MWRMNRQGEWKIFAWFFANANESATWQATSYVRFPGVRERSLAVNTRIDPLVRKVRPDQRTSNLSPGLSISIINWGHNYAHGCAWSASTIRRAELCTGWRMHEYFASHNSVSYTDPRLVIFLGCKLHYSEMFFIATGKMPSISNGWASACHVGRVSAGTFVRPVRPRLSYYY